MYRFLKRRFRPLILKLRGSTIASVPINTLRSDTLDEPKWRLSLYRTLAANYRAKVSFAQTLAIKAKSMRKSHPNSSHTRILSYWADRAGIAGVELHDVLAGWIPPIEQQILSGSEDEKGVEAAIWYLKKQITSSKSAKAALLYPCLLVAALFIALFFLGYLIMPRVYTATGSGNDHAMTLLAFKFAWLLFIPVFGGASILFAILPTWTGETRTWFDLKVWPWTMWRRRQGQAFLFAYASLLRRKSEGQALSNLTANAQPWHRQRITAIAEQINEGLTFASAAREAGHGFPDPEIIDTLDGIQADQKDIADLLQIFAEEASNAEDEAQTQSVLLFSQFITVVTIVCIALLAGSMIDSFNLDSLTDALGTNGQ